MKSAALKVLEELNALSDKELRTLLDKVPDDGPMQQFARDMEEFGKAIMKSNPDLAEKLWPKK
jgi:hypothetical protein